MSAQNTSKVDHLVTEVMRQRDEEEAAEEQRFQEAKASAKVRLADYIDTEIGSALMILDFNSGDFTYNDVHNGHNGWMARIDWDQDVNGKTYPLSIMACGPNIYIACASGPVTVSSKYLAPNVPDPVIALGEFLADLPKNWESAHADESARTYHRLLDRIDNAESVKSLLAIAAATDTNNTIFDDHRRSLRHQIAQKIRAFRNEERSARNDRNARLIHAVEIIELAQAYVQEYAWYELACYAWATAWTRELWSPGELYKVRYVPITADGNTEHCIQELVVVDHPSTMDMGDWNSVVTEVTSHGQIGKRWIGAFLDAKPIRWDKPLISDRYMYHTAIRAGDYYVNIPPADLVPVDTAAVEAARPEPPAGWIEWLLEHYDGSGQLDVPAVERGYNYTPVPMDAFDVARMTPAEFVDSPKIDI